MHPAHFSLDFAIRPSVRALPDYVTTTSDESQARSPILLDANENSAGNTLSCLASLRQRCALNFPLVDIRSLNRYPSTSASTLKRHIAEWRSLESTQSILLGSGASDVLDLILRATCTASQDRILIAPPTFELYRVRAAGYDIGVTECPLEVDNNTFYLPVEKACDALTADPRIKLVILASPGNPTSTLIPLAEIKQILELKAFCGLVVIDEAYIDFSSSREHASALSLLREYDNLIVVQSLSKSHGLAGIRLGMAFSHPTVNALLSKLQMPFSISTPTLTLASHAMSPTRNSKTQKLIGKVIDGRTKLIKALQDPELLRLGVGPLVGGSDGNFIMVAIHGRAMEKDSPPKPDNERAKKIADQCRDQHGIAVRYAGNTLHCKGCLRITVGTARENCLFLKALKEMLLMY